MSFVLGSKMLLYYDLISRLHTWLSCTACILASTGVFLFSVTYTKQEHLTRSQRYMLCRRHKHRLTYTTLVNSLQPLKPVLFWLQ